MNPINRIVNTTIATSAVFIGSILSDAYFGAGIQFDDLQQAAVVALLAGVLQYWLGCRPSPPDH